MAKIRYIGKKERKTDTIAGTGITWNGHGDVQEVPASAVAALLEHTDSFELDGKAVITGTETTGQVSGDDMNGTDAQGQPGDADNAGGSEQEEQADNADHMPPLVNLEGMDAQGLRDYAQKHFGHTFHHKLADTDKMRQTIIGLMNRG